MAFLGELEAQCQGRTALERLRAGAACTTFLRRWNLSVYFSLLYQEIAGERGAGARGSRPWVCALLKGAAGALCLTRDRPIPSSHCSQRPSALADCCNRISHGPIHHPPLFLPTGELEDSMGMSRLDLLSPPHPLGLQLPISAALARCLQRATSLDVFLPQLSDRFLRLMLQLARRYATWMEQALASRSASTEQQQQQQLQRQQAASAAVSDAGSEGGAVPAGPVSTSTNPVWVSQLPVEDLAVLLRDLQLVSELMDGGVRQAAEALLGPALVSDEAAAGAAGRALAGAAAGLRHQSEAVLEVMASELAERCVAVIKQLKVGLKNHGLCLGTHPSANHLSFMSLQPCPK